MRVEFFYDTFPKFYIYRFIKIKFLLMSLIFGNVNEGWVKYPVGPKSIFEFFLQYSDPATQELFEAVDTAINIVCGFEAEGNVFLLLNSFYFIFIFLILGKWCDF